MPFWHPRGWAMHGALADAVRASARVAGYREVRTPQLLADAVWARSGHREHFREHMFEVAGHGLWAKPVSCPGHIQLFARARPSYRDLPLRLFELGHCHRCEQSGSLNGLLRCQSFTQDDGHIFCAPDQVRDEVARFCNDLADFYAAMGFDDVRARFAGRPVSRAGDDAQWDRAERELLEAAAFVGLEVERVPSGGAFYGPKLEFELRDGRGRFWQCGTIQLDRILPERFDLSYVDRDGQKRRPLILHRAMCGSLERFLAIAIEHHRGALPAWLAPEQVVVASINDDAAVRAEAVAGRFSSAGIRVRLDQRSESLGRKVNDARVLGIPWLVAIGRRELESGTVSIRQLREPGSGQRRLDDAVAEVAAACRRGGEF